MGSRPRIADLFCGAGGAAKGLHDAGFEVVGFDIKPQPRYLYEFHEADALEVDLSGFDAVWASPPCQGYSIMNNLPWLKGNEYHYLILPVREMLDASGLTYVIENVEGAKYGAKGLTQRGLAEHGMQTGWLCGGMFGLPFYRHRMFETNWFWLQPGHPTHRGVIKPGNMFGSNGGRLATLVHHQNGLRGGAGSIGHGSATAVTKAAEAMGIDWMTRAELTQAIPPAYSEFLGRQLIAQLESVHA